MTTRRRTVRSVGLVARSRPRYTWRHWLSGRSVLAAGATLVFNLSTVGAAPDMDALGVFGDYTVRRLHLVIGATSNNGAEASSFDHFTWGITVVNSDAAAAGFGSLPNPELDAADWMAFGTEMVSLQGAFSAGFHPLQTIKVDNRSMRKVNENNQELVHIFRGGSANTGTIDVLTTGRMLVSHGQR